MKSLFVAILTLTSFSALAQWSGDILCVKPSQSGTQSKLVADAKGRITVKNINDELVATIALNELRLFSNYGTVRGSTIKSINLKGEVLDGNDSYSAFAKPISANSVVKNIKFDISTSDRQLSILTTARGNEYKMECIVRED